MFSFIIIHRLTRNCLVCVYVCCSQAVRVYMPNISLLFNFIILTFKFCCDKISFVELFR